MRSELRRQLVRRRTRVLLAAMVVIPLLLATIFTVRGSAEPATGATAQLINLADGSALAFAVFVLYLCAPLLMIGVAAALAGDGIGSEFAWGTMRYLLAAPISRRRLLARKLATATILTAVALLMLVGTSLIVGIAAFGWHPLDTPVGGAIETMEALQRLIVAVAYVQVSLLPFIAIALLVAALWESSLAAVGTSLGVAVLSQLLDVIEQLAELRTLLPTHYALAWLDLFVDPPVPQDLAAGTLQAAIYVVTIIAAASWRFSRRDITS